MQRRKLSEENLFASKVRRLRQMRKLTIGVNQLCVCVCVEHCLSSMCAWYHVCSCVLCLCALPYAERKTVFILGYRLLIILFLSEMMQVEIPCVFLDECFASVIIEGGKEAITLRLR